MRYRNPLQNVAGLASDAVGQAADLVQLEFRLARAELKEKALAWRAGAAMVAAGAVFAAAALFLVLQALVAALVSAGVQPAVATLIVAVGCVAIAAILISIGRKRLTLEELSPDRTLEDLQRDKNMVKEKLS